MANISACAKLIQKAYEKRVTPSKAFNLSLFSAIGGMLVGLGHHALVFSDIPIALGYEMGQLGLKVGPVIFLCALATNLIASAKRWSNIKKHEPKDIATAVEELGSKEIEEMVRQKVLTSTSPISPEPVAKKSSQPLASEDRRWLDGFKFRNDEDKSVAKAYLEEHPNPEYIVIEESFKEGGLGKIQLIIDGENSTDRHYAALKKPDFSRVPKDLIDEARRKFLDEAVILATAGGGVDSEYIVKIERIVHEPDGSISLIMEYIDGVTLDGKCAEYSGIFPADTAVQICLKVLKALESIHDNKIIHKDVSMDNVMLVGGDESKVKLIDFGIANLSPKTGGSFSGSLKPGYSPPELYRAKKPNPQSDFFSLGVTLYRMITGEYPFPVCVHDDPNKLLPLNELLIFMEDPRNFPKFDNVPMRLRDILTEMLQIDQDKRPKYHIRIKQAFEKYLGLEQPDRQVTRLYGH